MMRTTTRLLLAGAIAAASFGIASPASACDDPRKCASCRLNPAGYLLEGERLVDCYS